MKSECLILGILLISLSSIGQISIGRYQISSGSQCEADTSNTVLNICANGTFEYTYLASWASKAVVYKGTWKLKIDTLILNDTIIGLLPILGVKSYSARPDSVINIRARSVDGRPVEDLDVYYHSIRLGYTDSKGKFVINTGKHTSKSEGSLVVTFYKDLSNKLGGQSISYTDMFSADLEILLNEEAKNEPVKRTTLFRVQQENLIYLDQYHSQDDTIRGFSFTCNFVIK